MNNVKVAKELIKMAKSLIAFDGDKDAVAIQTKLDDLYNQFETNLSERVKAFHDAEAQFEVAKQAMKDAYSAFDKDTGWSKMMKACSEEIAAFQKAGGDIGKIQSKFKIASAKSKQPSYKEWLELVATTFNNAEFDKYMKLLEVFKKNTVTLSNGLDMADAKFKEWDDEMVKLYEERGKKAPKASKTAAVKDVVDFAKNICKKLASAFEKLVKSFDNSKDKMEEQSKKIAKLLA